MVKILYSSEMPCNGLIQRAILSTLKEALEFRHFSSAVCAELSIFGTSVDNTHI